MSRDKLRCMPPPLSALCVLDNRHHDRNGDASGFACAIHDKAYDAWCRARWILGGRS